jgi:hypothetical protein
MNRQSRSLATLLFAALPVLPAAAQENDVSPSFWSIARMPSTTAMSLQAFLSTPHHRMPDYSLSRQEIADISAYILSLKTARLDAGAN